MPDTDIRSPGGGDNLFISSIVALDAETGEYRWHYQATPHDSWDYDNTQQLVTADLVIRGSLQHVVTYLMAWDRVQRRSVWKQRIAGTRAGVLAAGGTLVFQSTGNIVQGLPWRQR